MVNFMRIAPGDLLRLALMPLYGAAAGYSLAISRGGNSLFHVLLWAAVAFAIGMVWAAVGGTTLPAWVPWFVYPMVFELGLILLFFELWRGHNWLGYVAASLIYFGFARMIALFRDHVRAPAVGRWLLLAGVVVLFAGLLLLGRTATEWPAVGCLIAAAMALFAGTQLAAERDQRGAAPTGLWGGGRRWLIALAVAAAGSAVGLGLIAHSWRLPIVVLAVVGLLTLAFVSRAPFDVVVVIALISLFGATRPEVALPPLKSGPLLLSLGDSYMSGEGAQVFFNGTDDAGGNQCRRAPTAYAERIPGSVGRYTSTLFLACSGAVTPQIYRTTQAGTAAPQLDQYRGAGSPPVSLAVVGIGGNDAGFSTIGEACIAPGNCDSEMSRLFTTDLPYVERNIEAALTAVHQALPNTPVALVPYPQPFYDAPHCPGVQLAPPERTFVRGFLIGLDRQLKTAAARTHTYFVSDVESALARRQLQLCDPRAHPQHCPGITASHGINFIRLQSAAGYASQRFNPKNWLHDSLHPNACGHDAELAAFHRWYGNRSRVLSPRGPHPGAALPGPPPLPAGPACSPKRAAAFAHIKTYDLKPCRSEATKWAMRELGVNATYLIALLLVMAGALSLLWRRSPVVYGPSWRRHLVGGGFAVLLIGVAVLAAAVH
jgi:hypothetical protein